MKDLEKKMIDNRIINPYVIEERPLNITQLDVFSRLMMDRILFLSGEVTSDSMDTLVAQMLFLNSVSHDPIHLYINSGGGECYSGLELVSVMNYIESPVYTTVLGLAASMGAVIASNGEKGHRKALPYSRFMIHQPSSGVGYSTFRDQQIHLKEMESLKQDLYQVLAKNSGQSVEEIERLCDRDNWMKPEEAIAMGFLDGVIEKKEA
jgi:ATP-dependent Clp protease protease subunit